MKTKNQIELTASVVARRNRTMRMAYSVTRRTREVSIRMAMGANRSQVRNLFFRHGVRLIVNGLILGVVLAITAGHSIESLLFGVAPADPLAFAAVVVTLGVVGGPRLLAARPPCGAN